MAMMSVADTPILPMQDILSLGEEARMNWPGRTKGSYRMAASSRAAQAGPVVARDDRDLPSSLNGGGKFLSRCKTLAPDLSINAETWLYIDRLPDTVHSKKL
jgi:hypothetical protein